MAADILPFNLPGGRSVRFGTTEDGTPYAVAADFAKAMGYRDAEKATRLLDEDEKGTQIVGTPGGPQRMAVIFEDGLWELIFRSTLPGAKDIKARVKFILRTIRETGRFEVAPAPAFEIPASFADALELAARQARELESATARVAELEPAARAWDTLADATGDYSLRDAAHILNRDPHITTGQNRLMTSLRDLGMVDRRGIPYAKHNTHLVERAVAYDHPHTGEPMLKAQVRITALGLRYLRDRLAAPAGCDDDGLFDTA